MLLYFVLSCLVALFVKCQDSPSCSQFYYVDSLLEKMIRMEIKVEALERQITDTNAEAQTALAELRRLREAFGNETEQLEQQRIEFEMLQLNVQQQLAAEIETAKDSLVIPNVLFKARTAKDLGLEAGQTIIFTNTTFNYGGGYDNITGIFTAPVNGVYLFNFHLCLYRDKTLHYGIVLNGVVKTSGHFYGAAGVQCFSINEMLPMHAGHKVWIKCSHSVSTLYEDKCRTCSNSNPANYNVSYPNTCAPGYSYDAINNMCKVCCKSYGTTFGPMSNYYLSGFNTMVLLNMTEQACKEACIAETDFLCRSIEITSNCRLSAETGFSQPQSFHSGSNSDKFWTRNCA